jgi:hypothetical protein
VTDKWYLYSPALPLESDLGLGTQEQGTEEVLLHGALFWVMKANRAFAWLSWLTGAGTQQVFSP